MASISGILERIRSGDVERTLGLRAAAPHVALELTRRDLALVRLKHHGSGLPRLDAHVVQPLGEAGGPLTIFDQQRAPGAEFASLVRRAFDAAGIRPGRVSLILPDNLAKISLLSLPERPSSRGRLVELVRFKMRKAVPFRLADAVMTYQVLPGEGGGVSVLVALARRALVEGYEAGLEAAGARPGLVDLCTPNLLNLCRGRIKECDGDKGDVALLNCAESYFSLVILRGGKLIFFRCKTYSMGDRDPVRVNGLLAREVASSFSYYQEKLAGTGIGTLFVRSVATPLEEIAAGLGAAGLMGIEPIDPLGAVEADLDPALAQRLAPAMGAALGRS